MISYILTVAAIIALSLLFYRVFLHSETFFRLNRLVLLGCLLAAFVLPLVHVPEQFSFRNAVQQQPDNFTQIQGATAQLQVIQPARDINKGEAVIPSPSSPITFNNVVTGAVKYLPLVYWAGVAIMSANLLLQIFVLLYRSRKNRVVRDGIYRIVEVDDDRAPCSFINRIYINPGKYDHKTYRKILAHEKIHVEQAHSIDLLLTEAMLALQWFNPLAWIYRKDVERNLEYLTDDALLRDDSFDRSEYQLSLLKVSVPHLALNITTNYNQSMLKKRIVMMNARRSNVSSTWKYMTLGLLMGVLVCNLNEPLSAAAANVVTLSRDDKPADEETAIASQQQLPAKINSTKSRNTEPVNTGSAIAQTEPLKTDTTHTLKFSNTTGRIEAFYEGGTFKMPFPDNIIAADAAFVETLSNLGYAALSRTQMDSVKTAGITPQFLREIAAAGYTNIPYKILCILKLAGVTPQYIERLNDVGYGRLKISKVIIFKFSNVEAAYIKSLQQAGLSIPLDLVTMTKSRGITPEYVLSFKDLGYNNLSYSRISIWKTQGVDADFIKGFNKIGFNDISEADVSLLKSAKITPEYVAAMKEKGLVYADLKKYAFASTK